MRSEVIPFQFDIGDLAKRLRRMASKHISGVKISLPFVSANVELKDHEKQIAKEIVIRLKDRRVLSAWECCDGCIDQALSSLQDIRKFLVEKQVELSELHDGPLFLLIDAMAAGIRQFLTFEQRLSAAGGGQPEVKSTNFFRQSEIRQGYFDGLEILRGHLSRCLGQVAIIADMNLPKEGVISNYQGPWQIDAYQHPQLSD